jgi:DNA topoisomerase-1
VNSTRKAIIVESPTKTRTLGRFLGEEYILLASRGHVRDLPKEGLAVDVDKEFEPDYVIIPSQRKTVTELKRQLRDVEDVYIATDPDREGEAIAWHLVETLQLKNAKRIEFNEITKDAVLRALEQSGSIDMSRVDAQQARRILDRLVGYMLSPVLWSRIGSRGSKGALSAGRVQSVALRLICDRERKIASFVPEEYWTIEVLLGTGKSDERFTAELKTKDGEEISLGNEAEVQPIVEDLQQSRYQVEDITKKRVRRNPQPPLRTSTLQRMAAGKLDFSADKTMRIAQQLYEGVETDEGTVGLITYMRTDSTRVAAEAQQQARRLITEQYGEKYVGKGSTGKQRKGVQDAHEAIRPTDVYRTTEQMARFLSKDQARLYELIWRHFIASQMAPAVYDEIGVDISADVYGLRAGGSTLHFPGYLSVLPQERDETEADVLHTLQEGQSLELCEVTPTQHFTKPPARFNEASLVRALEENGIGRPSTYAPTIETLRRREYVYMKKRTFMPTVLGFVVNDYLLANFPEIVDVEFTASVEQQLDSVQAGEVKWQQLLKDFYHDFEQEVQTASGAEPRVLDGELCPKCGGKLLERYSLYGKFAGCASYPDCDYTRDLLSDVFPDRGPEDAGRDCPLCGKPLVYRTSRRGERFIGCTGYPECDYTQALGPDGEPLPPPKETDVKCPECGGKMVVRRGRRGEFLGCSNYPKCRHTQPLDAPGQSGSDAATPTDQLPDNKEGSGQSNSSEHLDLSCDKCGAPMVVRSGRRGKFVACSAYPECKNYKPMSVAYDAGYPRPETQQLDEPCPECGKPLMVRSGRRGKFVGCSGFPACRYTRDLDTNSGD